MRFIIIILISGLVGVGVWGGLSTGLFASLINPASSQALEAVPAPEATPLQLESPLELQSSHSARANLGHLATISVTLQLPTASGSIVPVTVPVEVALNLDIAVTGGRAGIMHFDQQTVPVVAVQPLLMRHMLTTASDEEVLRHAEALTLIPTPTPTVPRAPTPTAPPSVDYNVNMRRGPDTTFPIVGKIRPGDTFAVVARSADGTWYRVMHSDGTTGWIAAYLIQGGPAPETLAVAALNESGSLEAADTSSP